jgi:uroporphyrinogen decarboxylase
MAYQLPKSSPNINNFTKTLRNKFTGYIPLAELGVHPLIKEKFLSRKIIGLKDEIEFSYKAGYDYVKLQPIADFNPMKIGLNKNYSYNDNGTILRKWASENKGVITNFDDFEKYIFPTPEDFDYSNFIKIKNFLPDGMGLIGQYGDIFTMTWEMMGFESFSFALFENENLVKELNNKLGNLVLDMFKNFAEMDNVNAIWYSDDIAYTNNLLVSPDVLDKYFFPWLTKIGDLAKANNKPFIYHSDGILYDVFDKIINCGVDAIHPIEPKAMNIEEVNKRFGDKLCLIGNIDVDLLSRGSEDDIRKNILENIEKLGFSSGYCVGSGNSIPEYVNFDNYITMLETVKEFNNSL